VFLYREYEAYNLRLQITIGISNMILVPPIWNLYENDIGYIGENPGNSARRESYIITLVYYMKNAFGNSDYVV
jgi:hypothetical protein